MRFGTERKILIVILTSTCFLEHATCERAFQEHAKYVIGKKARWRKKVHHDAAGVLGIAEEGLKKWESNMREKSSFPSAFYNDESIKS